MMPETVGPMAGATEMAMLTLPMTAPRLDMGTRVRMVVISRGQHDGSTTCLDDAGKQQHQESGRQCGQQRSTAEESHGKHECPARAHPLQDEPSGGGMTTAMVSMKPVASHCTVDALT